MWGMLRVVILLSLGHIMEVFYYISGYLCHHEEQSDSPGQLSVTVHVNVNTCPSEAQAAKSSTSERGRICHFW